MITFVATVHILSCLVLIGLVLMQDSKGDGVFSTQSSSNSVLGATGATTLANTLTKVVAGILVVTCIALAMLSARTQKSVVDSAIPTAPAAPAQTPVNGAAAVPASATPETTAPAAPAAPTAPEAPATK